MYLVTLSLAIQRVFCFFFFSCALSLYNSFSTSLHITIILFSVSNWHTYFQAASSPFNASKNVALCCATSSSSGSSGLIKCWSNTCLTLLIPQTQEHYHMLCSPQTALHEVVNCANHPLRLHWVSLHCHHFCWHDQLRNHTSQSNSWL
jgi:hypothetical protein